MKSTPISQVDVLFANGIYPIEFAFYYQRAFETKRLRAALKALSATFWPLFGEYKGGRLSSLSYREVDHFAEEVLHREIDIPTLADRGYGAYSQFKLPELTSLFFFKVMRLADGLLVIPKMSHLAGDGYSYFYFLSLLAALSRHQPVPLSSFFLKRKYRPHHRRTVLREFAFSGFDPTPAPRLEGVTVVKEHIARREVKALMGEAAHGAEGSVSANDVLAAWALKKIAGGKAARPGDDIDLTIPIDVRRRVKEYGPRFFGNGIWLHTLRLRRQDVAHSPLTEIAAHIRRAMPVLSSESYRDHLLRLENTISAEQADRLQPFDPLRGCLVTNLTRLPIDRLDFGAGPPAAVLPLTTGVSSAAILSDKDSYILHYAF